jgi:hypothetical protein
MVGEINIDNDSFLHITEASLYISYLSGNEIQKKLIGIAKSISVEKTTTMKRKSKIGLAGKPNIIYPSSRIVKGTIDKFISIDDYYYNKGTEKRYDSFYNMIQGFNPDDPQQFFQAPRFGQIERSINLHLIFDKLDGSFEISLIGVHAERFKRSMSDGFFSEKIDFLAYDMIDKMNYSATEFQEIRQINKFKYNNLV